ncbi:MAG: M4 family metallopeptidase [Bacteroidia bacterium]|nr:M4 family metallopeptidase [Bacteroidia bacterium]
MRNKCSTFFYQILLVLLITYSNSLISQTIIKIPQVADSSWIKFNEEQRINPVSFFQTHKQELGLGTEDKMVLKHKKLDKFGLTHYYFCQQYKGIDVIGGEYSIHAKNGIAKTGNGRIINNLSMDVVPKIDSRSAIQQSLEEVKKIEADKYGILPDKIKLLLDSLYPIKAELLISKLPTQKCEANNFKLIYRLQVKIFEPSDFIYYVYIDAKTGATIESIPGVLYSSPGKVTTISHGGPYTIQTTWTGSLTKYKLIDDTRGNGIKTRIRRSGINQYVNDDDNQWDDNYEKQIHASSHWAAETVWDFYFNTFERNGPDGLGKGLDILTNKPNGLPDDPPPECPSNSSAVLLDPLQINLIGPVAGTCNPRISLNTVGHEFTHGILYHEANFQINSIGPSDEAYALMEGCCDIFGEIIEFDFQGWVDWKYDDQSWINKNCEKTFYPPILDGMSALEYGDANWNYFPDGHLRGGVLRYWFFLLSEGGLGTNHLGNSYCINGISIPNAAKVLYVTINNNYFDPYSTFITARNSTIQVAINMYGPNSNEVVQVTNAWYAVGVGNKYAGKVNINNHITSGNEQLSYDYEIQTENLQVPVSTSLTIISSKQITIKSTLKSSNGSYFHAYIAPVCPAK